MTCKAHAKSGVSFIHSNSLRHLSLSLSLFLLWIIFQIFLSGHLDVFAALRRGSKWFPAG